MYVRLESEYTGLSTLGSVMSGMGVESDVSDVGVDWRLPVHRPGSGLSSEAECPALQCLSIIFRENQENKACDPFTSVVVSSGKKYVPDRVFSRVPASRCHHRLSREKHRCKPRMNILQQYVEFRCI
jgi:hypothetical protein